MASPATLTTTPPPLHTPGAKEKKYDRQLRLWAANGQRALEESHILLIIAGNAQGSSGSSVAGVETLKNLVLPGIGQFTIADSAKVNQADLGINFFLTLESLGRSRAEECRHLLEELNPDVKGKAISTPLHELLNEADWLLSYSLVILCAPVPSELRRRICQDTQRNSIPLIHVQSAGFYSSFSLQLPPLFPIVDTHPDPETVQDLRLLSPWPELVAEMKALGKLEDMEDHEHGHVPYILILLYYLQRWKQDHNDQPPQTFADKTQFRNMVKAGARTENAEGAEENFDEAAGAVLKTIAPFSLQSGCRDLFEQDSTRNLTAQSANFWIMAAATKSFYSAHGVLPLPGSLPDMKAKSADYIKLQHIYKDKAKKDFAEVTGNVRALEEKLGRSSKPILEAEIEGFCKNAAQVKVLQGSLLPQVRMEDDDNDNAAISGKKMLQEMTDPSSLPLLSALFAPEQQARARLKDLVATTAAANDDDDESTSLVESMTDILAEVDRAGSKELHNVSALTGGMVAQEAIKVITRQYVPVDNTCVFDGVKARTRVFKL